MHYQNLVQSMVIMKVSNCWLSFSVSSVVITDNNRNGYRAITGVESIATTTIGSSTYALVAAINR